MRKATKSRENHRSKVLKKKPAPSFGRRIISPSSCAPRSNRRSKGRFFFSILRITSSGRRLNCRSGVMPSQQRCSIILLRFNALSAKPDQQRYRQISKMARISRAADCSTYTMSAINEKPSSFKPLMYACSKQFT